MHPIIKAGVLISFAFLLTMAAVIMLEDIFEYNKYVDECKSLKEVANREFPIKDCTKSWNLHPEATEQEVFVTMDLQIMNQSLEDPIIIPNNDSNI